MAQIVPIAEYVAINLRNEKYLIMSEPDIKSCLQAGINGYLCYSMSPIYHLKNDENLCQIEPRTRKCKINYSTCTSEWIEISKINSYLFFCCSICYIRVLCEDQVTATRLRNAGIITVDQGCLIKTDNFTVYAHNKGSTRIHIENQFYKHEMEPINNMINISIPIPLQLNYSYSSNDKQLEEMQRQIHDLKSNEKLSQRVSYHDVHHYTLIYAILGVLLVIGAIVVARRVRNKHWTLRQPEMVTAEQASSQPTAGSSNVNKCDCECDNQVQCESVYSEIPKVHKVNKHTSPMPRKLNFT